MSLQKDIIEAEFRTTGANKLQNDIGATAGEIKRLNKENEMLLINKKKLEAQGKKDTKGYKQLTAEIKKNNEAIKNEKIKLEELNSKLKITEMSAKQLLVKKRNLTRELNNTSKALNPKKWNQLNGELKKVTTQYDKVRVGGRGVNTVMKKMGALLPVVGFAALVAGAKRLISNIIDVRKEFEKYEAVLKVSLGTQEQARIEMKMLQQFAEETPFQLQALTGAYVKLVNQGFKPTREEMRKLGDLSASTGKDLDQLAEGIIDAQTGEFERLKEFGIRASKEGDNVTFTFKGVETQVRFTAKEIQKYILDLGEMEGVSGSMAEISKTLGGRISNLGDAWDNLMNSMGGQTSGLFVTVINWMIDLTNTIDQGILKMRRFKQEFFDENTVAQAGESIKHIDVLIQAGIKSGQSLAEAESDALVLYFTDMENQIADKEGYLKRSLEVQAEWEEQFFAPIEKKKAKKRVEKVNYELQMLKRERQVIENHYLEVNELKRKSDKEYEIEEGKRRKEAQVIREKEEKEALEKEKKLNLDAIATLHEEEMNQLKQQLLDKEITEAEYEDLILNQKIAALELEIEIRRQAGEETIAIRNQILDLELEAIRKLTAEQDKARKDQEKKDDEAAKKKEDKDKQALADQIEAYNDKVKYFSDIAADLGQAMADAITSGDDAMAEMLRNTLLVALKYLRDFARAKILALSLAGADSIATAGIAGIAKAAALTALVETAYGIAKSALSKKAETNNYYTGGPTGLGGKYEPAGVVHRNEYVIPQEGFFNPALRPFLNMIEEARKAGTLRSLNMNQPAQQGYADGGPTTQMAFPQQASADPGMISLLEANIAFLQQLSEQGVIAYIGDPQVRDIRDRTKKIEAIELSVSK